MCSSMDKLTLPLDLLPPCPGSLGEPIVHLQPGAKPCQCWGVRLVLALNTAGSWWPRFSELLAQATWLFLCVLGTVAVGQRPHNQVRYRTQSGKVDLGR